MRGDESAAAAAPFASSASGLREAPLGEGEGRRLGDKNSNTSCPDSGMGSGWGSTGDEDDRKGSAQSTLLEERDTGVELAEPVGAAPPPPPSGPRISMSLRWWSLPRRVRRGCRFWCWVSRRLKKEVRSRRVMRWGEAGEDAEAETPAPVEEESFRGEEVERLFQKGIAAEDHGRATANASRRVPEP